MRRAALTLLVFSCGSAPLTLDAGTTDAGADAGQRICAPSSCAIGGDWSATFTLLDGGGLTHRCAPGADPLRLIADGGSVCFERLQPTSAMGTGCDLSFTVSRNGFDLSGTEVWSVQLDDAGTLQGTLNVDQQFPACTAVYEWRAVR